MNKKIIFIHSLNNYTGSPNVLSVVIRGLLKRGYPAEVITSRGDGFLSDIPGVKYRYTCYRWTDNRIITLALLMLSQIGLFFRVLFYSRKHLYYINTIVPFGAVLACRITGKRFVIHVHENMRQHKPLYAVFRNVYRLCNTKSIFVSEYLKKVALNCREGKVIYNSLPEEFSKAADNFLQNIPERGENILMISSLRRFKGVYEFAGLARQMPQYQFELVLSASDKEVSLFKSETGNIENLNIYPEQKDLHPFYQRAKLLLQLSHPESCVETFGLTILEAMAYGVPAIVPNAGGPTELIENNVNGFTINPHELPAIEEKIELLMRQPELYREFSEKALVKSLNFKTEVMINKIEEYII